MGKLIGLLVLLGLVGGVTLVYNVTRYDVAQPVPLAWTYRPAELRLFALRRERRALARRIGAERRAFSLAGLPGAGVEGDDDPVRAELARLDREIEGLEAELAASQP